MQTPQSSTHSSQHMGWSDKEQVLAARIGAALPGVTPGLCLRAYRDGQLVFDIQAGETWRYYDLASLTKVIFTQQAMMRAFDQGHWNLGTTVAEVLPDFPHPRVLLRELLTHSSGIEWWKPFYLSVPAQLSWQDKRAWLYEELKRARFEHSGKAVYSDLGFMLLGFVLEQFSGADLLAIWNALKADCYARTTLGFAPENQSATDASQFAPTEDCPWRKRVLRGEVHDDNTWALGGVSTHAGLFGSIDDVSAFGLHLRAQLQDGAGAVRRETARLFARRALAVASGDWALGWMLPAAVGASCGRHFSRDAIGHTGFTGTSVWYDPTRDLLVVLLSNRVRYGRDNQAFAALRPQIHDWVVESL